MPLGPAWAELTGLLTDCQTRFGLSKLMHYCSAQGIQPSEVTDAVLAAFFEDIHEAGLINAPRAVHRRACQLWNRVAAATLDWPQQRLTVPDYTRTYALPWSTFPASLKLDIDAYLERLAGKDVLADLPFRPLRPASLATRSRQLHEFLSALVHRGRDPASLESLRDVVAVEVAKDGLRFFLDRAAGQATPQALYIAGMIRAVAHHWVGVDAGHLAQLTSLCKRLDPGRRGLADKNRERLRQFDDPQKVLALLKLPQALMDEVNTPKKKRGNRTARQTALLVQTAVGVELLLMLPMRINNLARIVIGEHLILGRDGSMRIAIPGQEVKNGADVDAILPAQTARLIKAYITCHLPALGGSSTSCLFPGKEGGPKSCDMLREQIVATVQQWCGLTVNPHLFRHIAAKNCQIASNRDPLFASNFDPL